MTGGPELSILVVDDEPLARDLLRRTLETCAGVRRVDECAGGEEAVRTIRGAAPDLVFLDIRMPEVDGFQVIERVGPDLMPEVVFVTAHEEFTLRAFRVHAMDYVLKPYEAERIAEAVAHARRRIADRTAGHLAERLRGLVSELGSDVPPTRSAARRLAVRDAEGVRFLDVGDVDWLEAHDKEVRVHHHGTETHAVRISLTELLERLGTERFVRIHRSAAVNLGRVIAVRPWGHGDHVVHLETGKRLRLSRTYKDDLLRLVH
jgi:two-component system LytT family response regulator